MSNRLLKLQEAAEYCGLPPKQLRRLAHEGRVKVSGASSRTKFLFVRETLDRFLETSVPLDKILKKRAGGK